MIMSWLQQERQRRQDERAAARLATELVDRALNPDMWREIPAVWNHSDLEAGDSARDEGKRR